MSRIFKLFVTFLMVLFFNLFSWSNTTKDFDFPESIPDVKHRYYPLLSSYLSEKRMINTEDKTITGFFGFLLRKLFT